MEMIEELLDSKFTFKEILEIVEQKIYHNMSWRIYLLEATSKYDLNILELEDEIEMSNNGISYTFEALKKVIPSIATGYLDDNCRSQKYYPNI